MVPSNNLSEDFRAPVAVIHVIGALSPRSGVPPPRRQVQNGSWAPISWVREINADDL